MSVDLIAEVLVQHWVRDVSVGRPGRITGFRFECRCGWMGEHLDVYDADDPTRKRAAALRHVAEQVWEALAHGGVR